MIGQNKGLKTQELTKSFTEASVPAPTRSGTVHNVCFPSLGQFGKLQQRTATARWRDRRRACRTICKQRFYDDAMKEN